MIHGALAAAVTPLTSDSARIDEGAIGALVDFYSEAGLDGLLILGTTGEGILLTVEERRVAAEGYLRSAKGRLPIAVHCGCQSTRETVALAAHAAERGADAVAVIPPPYYALDDRSLLHHLAEAARACAPVPFFVYEFAARSGYAVSGWVLDRLRQAAPNLAGLKVSDTPFEAFRTYLIDGLDVFVGSEALISRALASGAVGAVSGLAAALPELTLAAVRSRSPEVSERVGCVRDSIQRFPFQSALKLILQRRGVRVTDAVRGPLRRLRDDERVHLEQLLADPSGEIAPILARGTGGALKSPWPDRSA